MNNGIGIKKNLLLLSIFISQVVSFSFFLISFQNFKFHFPFLLLIVFSASFLIFFKIEIGLIFYLLEMLLLTVFFFAVKYPSPYIQYFLLFFLIFVFRFSYLKIKVQKKLNSINLSLEGVEEEVNVNNAQYLELVKINTIELAKFFLFLISLKL